MSDIKMGFIDDDPTNMNNPKNIEKTGGIDMTEQEKFIKDRLLIEYDIEDRLQECIEYGEKKAIEKEKLDYEFYQLGKEYLEKHLDEIIDLAKTEVEFEPINKNKFREILKHEGLI